MPLTHIVKCKELDQHSVYVLNITRRYYEGGVSSVYLWDLDDGGFAGVVLLKKSKHWCCGFDPVFMSVQQ
jgi:hypothetical protein